MQPVIRSLGTANPPLYTTQNEAFEFFRTTGAVVKRVDFSCRAVLVEEMDRLGSPKDQLYRTLTQFRSVNRIFARYRGLFARTVLQDMAKDRSRSYRLVDLGAGGCDIARWLIRRCRERGLRLSIIAIEHDPRVARYARAANALYSEIRVVEADVWTGEFMEGADYVFANHLLHHLSNEECIDLIRQIDRAGPRQYLLSDLLRSPWAYYAYWVVAAPVFRNSFVVCDGLASIRRGFTLPEVRTLVRAAAPIHPVAVSRHLPSRFLIRGGTHADAQEQPPGWSSTDGRLHWRHRRESISGPNGRG